MTKRRRRGRSLVEYFVAFLGLVFLAFVVSVIATSRSCHVRVSPEVGVQPHTLRATPTAIP
jgi:Tfp pilus assembly protein PilW